MKKFDYIIGKIDYILDKLSVSLLFFSPIILIHSGDESNFTLHFLIAFFSLFIGVCRIHGSRTNN